jgi:uncharacterized protein YprB with RNaseH-like and TPR domain
VAKWGDERDCIAGSLMRDGKRKMLAAMHALLDEADAVVSWNGNGFDLKVLNKEFLVHGFQPPAPYKSIDLLATARKQFRFTSNKLDYVSDQLGLGRKLKHRGHQLWLDCMARKREAFDEMLRYNKRDVLLLERVYKRMRPWVKYHPNHSLVGNKACCPNCGGTKIQQRGQSITAAGVYLRFQCQAPKCGKWFRSAKAAASRIGFREAA